MIKVALGGRIAEEIFFGKITTGASDDIKKCTQIAMGIVTQYGMVDRLGAINYYNQEEGMQKSFSERTGKIIDEEVRNLINQQY
jgi:cell division protease FtsH